MEHKRIQLSNIAHYLFDLGERNMGKTHPRSIDKLLTKFTVVLGEVRESYLLLGTYVVETKLAVWKKIRSEAWRMGGDFAFHPFYEGLVVKPFF